MNGYNDDLDRPSPIKRFGFAIGVTAIIAIVGALFVGQALSRHRAPLRRPPSVTLVRVVAPPPPPPPVARPPEPKMQDQKMIEQVPVDDNETKPDEKPQSAPAPAVGTGIRGDGSGDAFGLGADDGRSLGRVGSSATGRAGRWGWYASEVQISIAEALRRDPRTRRARFQLEVRIWPDQAGRVTRARIKGSTGDAGLDRAIREEILTGFQLPEPPPPGMPSPIVLRVGARPPD